ncbi:SH2 domain-containing protein 1A-like [Scleropages formosus]|uniref:SH2 domain-containing protein 1A-like n=1 Tax=Scleropages formosus TaxID=113540 RepID=A0A8C9SCM4_SCLFO|nr:SH2 domain-containing protein 1A-like [Scleropages formosus]
MFYSVYYGKMSKEETERVLERYGREGSFLTRDSESEPGSYCLCVRRSFVVHTFRISRSAGGWAIQTPPGEKPQCFQTLNQLIDYYRKETPGNMVPLLHPLEKQALGLNEDPKYLEI